jgi:hypothetical protein
MHFVSHSLTKNIHICHEVHYETHQETEASPESILAPSLPH